MASLFPQGNELLTTSTLFEFVESYYSSWTSGHHHHNITLIFSIFFNQPPLYCPTSTDACCDPSHASQLTSGLLVVPDSVRAVPHAFMHQRPGLAFAYTLTLSLSSLLIFLCAVFILFHAYLTVLTRVLFYLSSLVHFLTHPLHFPFTLVSNATRPAFSCPSLRLPPILFLSPC